MAAWPGAAGGMRTGSIFMSCSRRVNTHDNSWNLSSTPWNLSSGHTLRVSSAPASAYPPYFALCMSGSKLVIGRPTCVLLMHADLALDIHANTMLFL
jgi:hypothetical protein